MREIPAENYSPKWADEGSRVTPPLVGDERQLLTAYLDWHRASFALKCAGHVVPMLYYSDEDPDQDFESLEGDFDVALAAWQAECAKSREIVGAAESLDVTGVQNVSGKPISLRRIMLMMNGEYARLLGHADLLRERIDGATGY